MDEEKTISRPVVSVTQSLDFHAPVRLCPNHLTEPFRWHSPVLAHVALPHRRYDMKVTLLLGLESLFLEETELRSRRHSTVDERMPSTGTVSLRKEDYLLRNYALHRRSFPAIRRYLDAQGGYVLHMDGTETEGSPVVLVAWDEWSGLVLDSRVVSTENEGEIAAFFRDLEHAFGRPCGLCSDMGEGIRKAAGMVWSGVPHQLCHFHYVRALGKDLFKALESSIRRTLLAKKVLARLGKLNPGGKGDWLVFGQKCAKELEGLLSAVEPRWVRILQDDILSPRERASQFPFTPTYGTVANRAWAMDPVVHELLEWNMEHDVRLKTLTRAGDLLRKLTGDKELSRRVHRMKGLMEMYSEFREALGVGRDVTGSDGKARTKQVEAGKGQVEYVLRRWEALVSASDDEGFRDGVRKVRESWEKRKAHLYVEVRDRQGVLRTVERTNWRSEQGHRAVRFLIRGRTRKSRTEEEMTRHGALIAVALNWGREGYAEATGLAGADIVRELSTVSKAEMSEARARKGRTQRCRSDVTKDRHREPMLRELVKILKAGRPEMLAEVRAWMARRGPGPVTAQLKL